MSKDSDNAEKEVSSPDEVPSLDDETFFECPNPECTGSDESFKFVLEHEIDRIQDFDEKEITVRLQDSRVILGACNACDTPIYVPEEMWSTDDDSSNDNNNDDGGDNENSEPS